MMMMMLIRFWWYCTLTFGFESYFRIFVDRKIACKLKTTGHIFTQFYRVMHLTWFSKRNKSGRIWPWSLTLTAKTNSRMQVCAVSHSVYFSLNFWKTDVSFVGHFLMLSSSRSSTSGMRHDIAMMKNTAHISSARIGKLQYQADASTDSFVLLLCFAGVPNNQANCAQSRDPCDITRTFSVQCWRS